MTEAHKQAISVARMGIKFSAKHRANIARARRGTRLSEETKQKISKRSRELAASPIWRQKVSEGTKRNYNHKKQRAGLIRTLKARGIPHFFTGGQGMPPRPYMVDYAKILRPAGFVMEYQMQVSSTTRFRLDFAHPLGRVNIEIDGSVHQHPERRKKDQQRDAILRSKGWKVIRVREW